MGRLRGVLVHNANQCVAHVRGKGKARRQRLANRLGQMAPMGDVRGNRGVCRLGLFDAQQSVSLPGGLLQPRNRGHRVAGRGNGAGIACAACPETPESMIDARFICSRHNTSDNNGIADSVNRRGRQDSVSYCETSSRPWLRRHNLANVIDLEAFDDHPLGATWAPQTSGETKC